MLQMLVQNLQLLYHNHQQHELHVAKSTAGHKQKGNHGNHAQGSSSLLLVYFVAEVQRHLQVRHMYYSVSSAFERARVNGRLFLYRLRFVCICVCV